MIKNWGLLVAASLAVGCNGRSGAPPGYQGIVELDERQLGFEVSGRLREVPVHRGQHVEGGQALARLDDGLALPVRDARAAELAAARAQVALLQAGARGEDVRALAAQVRAAEAARDK